jgi:hypothetical protein
LQSNSNQLLLISDNFHIIVKDEVATVIAGSTASTANGSADVAGSLISVVAATSYYLNAA